MIEEYLEHHFEHKGDGDFEIEQKPAYLAGNWWDFQSLNLTHRLLDGGC